MVVENRLAFVPRRDDHMFKKILLPTDGSEHSIRATEKAIELAKLYNGTIDLIYVIDSKTSKSDVLNSVSKIEIEKHRKERVQPVHEQVTQAGVESTVTFLYGEPGPTIVRHANDGIMTLSS